jgi:hypothetical protein
MIAVLGLSDEDRHVRGKGTLTHVPLFIGGSWISAMLLLLVNASSMSVASDV